MKGNRKTSYDGIANAKTIMAKLHLGMVSNHNFKEWSVSYIVSA